MTTRSATFGDAAGWHVEAGAALLQGEGWRPGHPQLAFDKQVVRDWAAGTGWDKRPPAPAVSDAIFEVTRARCIEAYERITGLTWTRE